MELDLELVFLPFILMYFRTMCNGMTNFQKIVRDLETRPTLKAGADNLLKIVGTYQHTLWSEFSISVQNGKLKNYLTDYT